jgi:oligogalacturonide lyase
MIFSHKLSAQRDPITGVRVIQVTSGKAANHHLYPSGSTCTSDGRFVAHVSHESGSPNFCCTEIGTGELWRLTYRRDINPFSGVLTRDDMAVLFTAGEGLWAVTMPDGTETLMASFAGSRVMDAAVSPDGRFAAVTLRAGGRGRIVEVDLASCGCRDVLVRDGVVSRARYSPLGDRILYSGGAGGGIRVVNRDGTADRLFYAQPAGEWVINGAWLDSNTALFVKFHDGLYAVGALGQAQALFKGPVWHPAVRSDAKLVVCDSHSPDIGLVVMSADGTKWRTLCYPRSSNRGLRWGDHLPTGDETMEPSLLAGEAPVMDGKETEYGPEWTHPHPSFSPDGTSVFYTSDVTGDPQVYLAEIPPEWLGTLIANGIN